MMFLSPAMAFYGCVLVYLILVSFQWTGAVEEEWRSATATYAKETNASIVIGESFLAYTVQTDKQRAFILYQMINGGFFLQFFSY